MGIKTAKIFKVLLPVISYGRSNNSTRQDFLCLSEKMKLKPREVISHLRLHRKEVAKRGHEPQTA